jgi:hypothetical protein
VSTWDKYAPHLFLMALVLLVIVLIPRRQGRERRAALIRSAS